MADLPEYMHSFEEDAGKDSTDPNQPPNAISGSDLDKNFVACLPVEEDGPNAPYKVKKDSDGWKLEPQLVVDICENGQPRKIKIFGVKVGAGGGTSVV